VFVSKPGFWHCSRLFDQRARTFITATDFDKLAELAVAQSNVEH
jgi:hypothetical protein